MISIVHTYMFNCILFVFIFVYTVSSYTRACPLTDGHLL